MDNSIDELVKYIKEDIKTDFENNYIVSLNEKDITLTSHLDNTNKRYSVENSTGMFDFIYKTIKSIIKEIPFEIVMSKIELHDFMGYDSSVEKGPIELLFEMKDGKTFTVAFSSKYSKNIKWLIDYMRYEEFKEDSEYIGEFEKLDNILDSLEFGNYEIDIEQNQETERRHI